ncbi:formate C-acetyltransferase/glycerol dehydratase family glycyl radical enzyme [Clostridium bovifaecis]|uniref:Formate C-acetyltransferase/glycerol dehydratase family glycyl radical enzyme n=1 Tax=Clostridium bovifaecis TaxID=2184719 RepID=A0A6I6EZP4_9CLOT|nr:formate C-acetyltransferase/glycerol dehydratase family glycyl radical enzyme [Clostridium bovifaecis]
MEKSYKFHLVPNWDEQFDILAHDFTPSKRIQSNVDYVSKHHSEIDPERAMLVTESYKATENQPMYLRRAKALYKFLEEKTIYIKPDELVVGNLAFKPLSSMIYPEYSYDWIIDEMENQPFDQRELEPYIISEETKEKLRSIKDYWLGNTVFDRTNSILPEEVKTSLAVNVFDVGNYITGGIGHFTCAYDKAIDRGLFSIRKEILDRKASLDKADPDYADKVTLYDSLVISIDAVEVFAKRYAKLARKLAEKETDEQRKWELTMIAENCERVPMYPARTFWEACQSFWFIQIVIQIESNGHSISPGRWDQYMYPYYKADVESGLLTKREAQELVDSVWVKLGETEKIKSTPVTKSFSGACKSQNLQAGGLTRDGLDATNDLSYIVLNASGRTKMCEPAISVRLSVKNPDSLWEKAIEVNKLGIGMPAFYNDEVTIQMLLNRGVTLEDARDFSIVGCVEPDVPGKTYAWHDSGFFNLLRCLELALNDGYPMGPAYKKYGRVGVATGKLTDMKSIEDVKEAYKKQVEYFADLIVLANNVEDKVHQEMAPVLLPTLLIDPCIEKGIGVSHGGAKYNFTGPQGIAISNVADSLAAIDTMVFKDKKVTAEELYKALLNNWKGHEVLQQKMLQCPHFGNDDDYVDELGHFAAIVYCKAIENRPNARGGIFQPGLYPVSANIPFGETTWASADGREAGVALADGISPVHGRDVNGPTAALKSVAKVDHVIASNGTLLNQKYHPSALSGIEGNRNFMNAMKVYFEKGGFHNQVNVVSADTLRDAQKHPEKYKNLVVRVAGYSAYFVRLGPALQNDIIERTEFIMA